jgi:coatomer protein complex subunit epsilon
MDPFAADSELIDLRDHFYAGRYTQVLEYSTSHLADSNKLSARVLTLRARIALGEGSAVAKELKGEKEPELLAVRAWAEYLGGDAGAVKVLESLVGEGEASEGVLVLAGAALIREGRAEEALQVLGRHQGSRKCSFISKPVTSRTQLT